MATNHEVRRTWLERELRRTEELIALRASFGEDVFEDGTVVTFEVTFNPEGKAYQYAAVRVSDHWYVTSTNAQPRRTWEQLITWLVDRDVPTTEMWVCTEWTRV